MQQGLYHNKVNLSLTPAKKARQPSTQLLNGLLRKNSPAFEHHVTRNIMNSTVFRSHPNHIWFLAKVFPETRLLRLVSIPS